ncbi:STAS domain-containing protein [Actinokineospora sp. 24-640]
MGDPLLLRIDVGESRDGGSRVVAVAGELDFATSPRLFDAVAPIAAGGQGVVLDMAEVTFCDSSGLNALVRLHKAAMAAGGSLCLARLRPIVATIISVVSLDQLFTLSDDLPGSAG